MPMFPSLDNLIQANMPINLNVSGRRYEILPMTIQIFPDSEFKNQIFAQFPFIFLNCNPDSFEILLDFVRSSKLYLRPNTK